MDNKTETAKKQRSRSKSTEKKQDTKTEMNGNNESKTTRRKSAEPKPSKKVKPVEVVKPAKTRKVKAETDKKVSTKKSKKVKQSDYETEQNDEDENEADQNVENENEADQYDEDEPSKVENETEQSNAKQSKKSKEKSKKHKKEKKEAKTENVDKKENKKRVINLKPTVISYQGIGIGPARVKNVLACVALNRDEYSAKNMLTEAENKPKKVKPSKSTPNQSLSEQKDPKPLSVVLKESEVVSQVMKKAEELHENSLREKYEREKLNQFTEVEKKTYNESKTSYMKTLKDKSFDLQVFNSSYSPSFYNGFNDFKKSIEEDNRRKEYERNYLRNLSKDNNVRYTEYATRRENAEKDAREQNKLFDVQVFNKSFDKKFYDGFKLFKSSKTELSHAKDLISKLLIRISIPTRYILASFLDQIVMQYYTNGVINCIKSGKTNIQLKHVLTRGPEFENTVPLDKFVRTLNAYTDATNWLTLCENEKAKFLSDKKQRKANKEENIHVKFEEPEYPDSNPNQLKNYSFNSYINDICRYVRMQLAEEHKNDKEIYELYHSLQNSHSFKDFCSYILYQTILRVGTSLRFSTINNNTKTINAVTMTNAINNICLLCGIDDIPIMKHIEDAKNKYYAYKSSNKKNIPVQDDQSDNEDNDSEVNIDESDKE